MLFRSRPKLSIDEKMARLYFKDKFLIYLKNNLPEVAAVWKANGGSGLLFKVTEEMTDVQKATVEKNLAAKNQIIKKRVLTERKKREKEEAKAGNKVDLDLGA